MLQIVEFDRRVFTLDKAHTVDQILAGKLAELGAFVGVPGIDQHIVAPLAHT
ncbi:hypothetical protein D3C76_1854310 [compost metagenome]